MTNDINKEKRKMEWCMSIRYVAKEFVDFGELSPDDIYLGEFLGVVMFNDSSWIIMRSVNEYWFFAGDFEITKTKLGEAVDFLWENHSQYNN